MADFDVECKECGETLNTDFRMVRYRIILDIGPCETCAKKNFEKGVESGKEESQS